MIIYVNSERAGQALVDGGYPEDLIIILPSLKVKLSEEKEEESLERRKKALENLLL